MAGCTAARSEIEFLVFAMKDLESEPTYYSLTGVRLNAESLACSLLLRTQSSSRRELATANSFGHLCYLWMPS